MREVERAAGEGDLGLVPVAAPQNDLRAILPIVIQWGLPPFAREGRLQLRPPVRAEIAPKERANLQRVALGLDGLHATGRDQFLQHLVGIGVSKLQTDAPMSAEVLFKLGAGQEEILSSDARDVAPVTHVIARDRELKPKRIQRQTEDQQVQAACEESAALRPGGTEQHVVLVTQSGAQGDILVP